MIEVPTVLRFLNEITFVTFVRQRIYNLNTSPILLNFAHMFEYIYKFLMHMHNF